MTSETQEQPTPADISPVVPPDPHGQLFPLFVVMLAVFPVTLGVSFTRQSPVEHPVQAAADPNPPTKPNDIQPSQQYHHLTMPDRSQGDELLREGRYEAALHLYRSLGSDDPLRVAPELALRMGFCQEGLGQWEESLATYRSAANSSRPDLMTAAFLGQSRVWMRLGELASAESLLRSLLLRSEGLDGPAAESQAEVAMLYPVVMTELALANREKPKPEFAPVTNLLEWSLTDALRWIDVKPRDNAKPAMKAEVAVTKVATEEEFNPLKTTVVLTVPQQSFADALKLIASECGLNLEWGGETQQRAHNRVVTLRTRGLPVCVALSALCREFEAEWSYEPAGRVVRVSDLNINHPVLGNCEIMLRATMSLIPAHRLSGPATFALAELMAAEGHVEEAVQLYTSLTGAVATPLAIRAALNAALVSYQTGDRVRTCQLLQIVVHGGAGNEFHTRALILHGRALLDCGDFREAAFQLKRAAGSRHRPAEQSRAAVLQAMAEILDGRPQAAAESLFTHRMQFQDRTVRNAAALMTSIARWRTLPVAERNREAAFLYRSIAAVDEDSAWLGPTGQLLLGQAMHDADLDDRMVELYTEMLADGVPPIVEDLVRLGLADYWYAHERRADSKLAWTELHSKGGAHAPLAAFRLAMAAIDEHQTEKCLDYCQTLRDNDSVPRAEILKLAGRAYEMSGRPVLAAQCFAGEWPMP